MSEKTETEKKDIFDKLMSLPGLRIFEPFYKKYKEVLLYLLFGGLAFFLYMGIFYLFDKTGMNELVNTCIDWVICVLFQFYTNRTWVFDAEVDSKAGFFKQMGSFFAGRFFTLIVDEAITAIFITWLSFPKMPVKLVGQVVVIVLNYVISKLIVFKKKED